MPLAYCLLFVFVCPILSINGHVQQHEWVISWHGVRGLSGYLGTLIWASFTRWTSLTSPGSVSLATRALKLDQEDGDVQVTHCNMRRAKRQSRSLVIKKVLSPKGTLHTSVHVSTSVHNRIRVRGFFMNWQNVLIYQRRTNEKQIRELIGIANRDVSQKLQLGSELT